MYYSGGTFTMYESILKDKISFISENTSDIRLKDHIGERVLIETDVFDLSDDSERQIPAVRIKFLEGSDKGIHIIINPDNLTKPYLTVPKLKLLFYKLFV